MNDSPVDCQSRKRTDPQGDKGDRDSGGRSPRDFEIRLNLIVTRSPSVAYGASSLPEGASGYAQP